MRAFALPFVTALLLLSSQILAGCKPRTFNEGSVSLNAFSLTEDLEKNSLHQSRDYSPKKGAKVKTVELVRFVTLLDAYDLLQKMSVENAARKEAEERENTSQPTVAPEWLVTLAKTDAKYLNYLVLIATNFEQFMATLNSYTEQRWTKAFQSNLKSSTIAWDDHKNAAVFAFKSLANSEAKVVHLKKLCGGLSQFSPGSLKEVAKDFAYGQKLKLRGSKTLAAFSGGDKNLTQCLQ